MEDLAATDFSAAWAAVSWAREVFTVEFGMGSGVVPPPWPPGRPNQRLRCQGQWPGASDREMGVRVILATDQRSWPLLDECCARLVFLTTGAWPLATGFEPFGRLGPVSCRVAAVTLLAYRRAGLARPSGRPGFEGGFPLRCFQRLSSPHIATRRCRWRDNRCTRGASIPVLSY